jgi:hypothetical protein
MFEAVARATQARQVAHVIASAKVQRHNVVHFLGRSAASLTAVAITQQHARP